MIVTAPGKVVLWGEYAVLAGAPAAVMAVDRRARVTLDRTAAHQWAFSAEGFLTPGVHTHTPVFVDAPVCGLVNAVLAHWGEATYSGSAGADSAGWIYHADSTPFFRDGAKLGLGSSAAVGVATYAALCAHRGREASLEEALAVHHTWQAGGSGLDVAASWCGGVIRYENAEAQPMTLPDDLHTTVVWTGHTAETPGHVKSFAAWRERGRTQPLEALCVASEALFSALNDQTAPWLQALARYTETLRALDTEACLNIFTQEHVRLATIAKSLDLVYKPCGAGGGDIGMAFSMDPTRLAQFNSTVQAQGFVPLHTEIAAHGIQISR